MLMMERQLLGSHSYEPLDYIVMIQTFFLLITETKPNESRKGIAKNLVQIDSVYKVMFLF